MLALASSSSPSTPRLTMYTPDGVADVDGAAENPTRERDMNFSA